MCGGMRLTLCVVFPNAFSMLSSLSHFTSHTHSHSPSVIFGYAGQSAVLGRDCASRTRCRGGRGYVSLLFPYVTFPRYLCCSTTHPFSSSPPRHMCMPPKRCASARMNVPPPPAADPLTFDSCTAALLLPCITLQLQYVPSCTYVHAHMSYPPCIYVRTVHAPSSCLQPSPLRSPPSSPSPVSSSDRALCFGFSPVLDFGSGSGLSLVPVSFYSTYNLLAVRVCVPITANHCTSTKCIKRLLFPLSLHLSVLSLR